MAAAVEHPPELLTSEGRPRRVGVEIEFAGIDAAEAAALVQELYGGAIHEVSKHCFEVVETCFGEFKVEIDLRYVHDIHVDDQSFVGKFKDGLADIAGDVASLWLPLEIVAPPVEIAALSAIDQIVPGLRARRAEGTRRSVLYAFGLQLNPDVPSTDPDSLRRHLQAYLVLSPWLRAGIQVDATRRLLPFAAPFPDHYARRVLAADYRPDLHGLVADYLAANPTRDRELDLLPLFAHVAPDQTYAKVTDPLVKPRPTFHYRLPDSRVDEPSWGGVIEEWNRWVMVERLAADSGSLAAARRARLEGPCADNWIERLRHALDS